MRWKQDFKKASALLDEGKYVESEKEYSHSLSELDQSGGESRVGCLIGLAEAKIKLDKLEEAEPLLTQALAVEKEHSGEESAESAEVMTKLGGLYVRMDRFFEAETLLTKALEIAREKLAADDPHLADTFNE